MHRAVLHIEGSLLVLAVIAMSWHLVHPLPKTSAESDIHFLKAATNRKHRYTSLNGPANQRQGGGIALRIVQRTGLARPLLVVMGFDVRRATGQQ